jgi:hypothetical protein
MHLKRILLLSATLFMLCVPTAEAGGGTNPSYSRTLRVNYTFSGKQIFESYVISDGCHNRSVGAKRVCGDTRTVKVELVYKLACQMLGIGCRSAVPGQKSAVTLFIGACQHPGRLLNLRQQICIVQNGLFGRY